MRTRLGIAVLFALLTLTPHVSSARRDLAGVLSFEKGGALVDLDGWSGMPPGTLRVDSTVVHGGRRAGLIERSRESFGEFSTLTLELPLDFQGDTLELRGWLRYENVTQFVGLWQRQDGVSGPVQFDNMASRRLSGSADWKEHRVALPLDPGAKQVFVGALLVGEGRLWVDDLRILVDGRPLAESPELVHDSIAATRDHEFDGGSRIAATALSPAQIANLVTLGKVWGFLKYHHPRVTSGELHWDYELFRVLPQVLAARDTRAAQNGLVRWLQRIGEPARCSACAELPDGLALAPRLDWLSDEKRLGRDLGERLRFVYAHRDADGEQHYVQLTPMVQNAGFGREVAFRDPKPPDAGFRLLALYRLWNIIEYWFPYRDVMREDWDAVLAEFVPRVFAAATDEDYALTLMTFIARVHDGHANLRSARGLRPPRGDGRLPIRFRFVEGRAVVGGFTDPDRGPATGLEIGDVVSAIDGTPMDTLLSRWRPYYGSSNDDACLGYIARTMARGPMGPVSLTVERGGRVLELGLERTAATRRDSTARHDHVHPGGPFLRLSDDLAYLELSSVKFDDATDYVRRAAGAKCLVVDLRTYPSDFLVFALGQHLVRERTPFVKFTHGDLTNPGAFQWTPPLEIAPREPHFEGQVMVLVDEQTQSSAEYHAMAFRAAPGARVVGSTTAGADGNVSAIALPGGLETMISGVGVFYPEGRPTQRVGITLDHVVRPTIAGIRAGRDEVLEEAVALALKRPMTEAERAALRSSPTPPSAR